MGLIDGDRVYPVNDLIIHHADTPTWDNESDQFLIDWYSNNGKARAYSNGAVNPNHNKPGSQELSYSQAHATIHPYTLDGNKYGWRWVWLIDDPWDNVTWGAANWPVNQRCINVEICGNYLDHEVDQKALMLIADMWRGHDQQLGGNTAVYGHSQVSQLGTQCPAQILNQLGDLIDMINNPEKWNAQLWPAPVAPTPPPVPAPAPQPAAPATPAANPYTRFPAPMNLIASKQPTMAYDLSKKTWAELGAAVVKQLNKGDPFVAVGKYQHPLGGVYYMTDYSFGKADTTGTPDHTFGVNTVDLSPAPEPTPPAAPTTTPDKPTVEPAAPATPTSDGGVTVPVKVIPPDPNKYQSSYNAYGAGLYTANEQMVIKDLAGEHPDQLLLKKQPVKIAGSFTKDNVVYYRTEGSVRNGYWYGIPEKNVNGQETLTEDESIFDDLFNSEVQHVGDEINAVRATFIKFFGSIAGIFAKKH